MEVVSKDIMEKGIAAVYKALGLKDAILFFRTISGGKADFTVEHKVMAEFSDENVKRIFKELTR